MKKELIISVFLVLVGSQFSFCQKTTEAESSSGISFSDLEEKVFDFGSLNNFTDSCSFYFECDCCSGNFLFNSDSSYFLVTSCLNSETLSSGKFEINHDTLSLISNEVSLTRRLDEWKMELSGEVEYYFTDTVQEVNHSHYKLSRCDGKIMLTNIHEPTLAVETQENIKDQLESLQKKGFLKRLEELEANSEELNKTSFSYLISKINHYLNFYSSLHPLGDREYDIR